MARKTFSERAKPVINPKSKEGFGVRIIRTEKEKLELAKKICDLYSLGRFSLKSVCDRYMVKWQVFSQWACPTKDITSMLIRGEDIPYRCIPEVHEMYKEARRMAELAYMDSLREKSRTSLMAKVEGVPYEEVVEEMEIDSEPILNDGSENPNFGQMVVKKRKVKKGRHQPDTAAIIFALTNVDEDNFKNKGFNKNINENTIHLDTNGLETLTDDELIRKRKELEVRLLKLEGKHREDYEEAEEVEEDETVEGTEETSSEQE